MNIISQGACWSRCQQVHVHCLSPKGPPVTGSRRPFKLSFRSSVHLFICSFTDPALNSAQLTDACSVQTQSWPRVPQRCDRRLSPGTHSPVGGALGPPALPLSGVQQRIDVRGWLVVRSRPLVVMTQNQPRSGQGCPRHTVSRQRARTGACPPTPRTSEVARPGEGKGEPSDGSRAAQSYPGLFGGPSRQDFKDIR